MIYQIQMKINSNPNYKKYLRENSEWYKLLNRNPDNFNLFVKEVKKEYKLRTEDKIQKALDTIEIMQTFALNLK